MKSHSKHDPVMKTPPTTTLRGLELEAKLETVQDEIERRRNLRKHLKIFNRPASTLGHFCAVVGGWLTAGLPYVLAVLSFVGAVACLRPYLPATFSAKLDTAIFASKFVSWWFLLGVLQTVGFGSGLQSGVMFMLPHILRTTFLADECGHLGFDSLSDVWYNSDPSIFRCDSSTTASASGVPVIELVVRLLPSVVCFQIGATCGEVPPYFMSYTAAQAKRLNSLVDSEDPNASKERKQHSQAEEGEDEAWIEQLLDPSHTPEAFKALPRHPSKSFSQQQEPSAEGESKSEDQRLAGGGWAATKAKMEAFIQRNGFWAIWALATFPSGAFDLCGVCCGQLQIPFRTFFGATLSGKALVRAPVQVVGLVLAARESTSTLVLAHASSALSGLGVPEEWGLHRRLAAQIALLRSLAFTSPPAAAAAAAAPRSSTNGLANRFGGTLKSVMARAFPGGGGLGPSGVSSSSLSSSASAHESVGSEAGGGVGAVLGVAWGAVVGLLMLFFLVSTIEEVARQRAGRQDEDAILSLRHSLGFKDHEFPALHLSPALRSPKARHALRQPLFSPSSTSSGASVTKLRSPQTSRGKGTVTPLVGLDSGSGSSAGSSGRGTKQRRRRRAGERPVPEKLTW